MADRLSLPRGGAVMAPSPYRVHPSYPTYADRAPECAVAYRNWRSMASGHPECDGMIAAARADRFSGLDQFRQHASGALSIQWSAARTVAGTMWTPDERSYPVEQGRGADGPELTCRLDVHRVGWFDVYDKPAVMLVAQPGPVVAGVWIYDSHGGLEKARQIVRQLAGSFIG